ncbi:WD40 repeat-like protein [Lactarius deliciosus]|nr:WD40 repeat-like protein [Lactarius deliciosus]
MSHETTTATAATGTEDVPAPVPNYKPHLILSGHRKSISSVKFSPDGNLLASAGALLSATFPQVSYRLYRQAADKLIKIWDATTGDIIQTLSGHSEGISDIAWSAHSDYIASASDDKTVRIWSLDETTVKILRGHTNFVFCVNYNPRSNLLVSGGFDETVLCPTGKSLKVLPAHSDPVTAVSFSHDGTLIVSCAMDGLIRIWDADSGQCLKTLVDDDNPVWWCLITDSTIRLWNYQTSRCVKTYTGHTNATYSLVAAFSTAGGQYIVSGSEDARIYIWDLQSRRVVQTLEGHKDVILAIDAHPTRKLIASASMEKDLTIRLWLWSDE